jgi:hypothetical protein
VFGFTALRLPPRGTALAIGCAVAALACVVGRVRAAGDAPEPLGAADTGRPVAIRVQWGGGQPRAWSGTVSVVADAAHAPLSMAPDWRTLCTEPDAAAMVHQRESALVVHQPRPIAIDGVEVVVPGVRGWRIVAAIGPAESGRPTATLDVRIEDVLLDPAQALLDDDGNRLSVKPAAGEHLRVSLDAAGSGGAGGVWRPGDRVRCTVHPLLPTRVGGTTPVELRMRLESAADGREITAQAVPLKPVPDAGSSAPPGSRQPLRFEPAVFDVALPGAEGVYEVALEAVERGGVRWSRPLATRRVQLPAVADEPPPRPEAGEWRLVYELDPASPRLLERLRRLPGTGLASVPLPRFTRPNLPLPKLPSVPMPQVPLPAMPLPSVSSIAAMVPRLSGLLAAGHSRVDVHPLGPMLRLPAVDAETASSWEGIVVAGAQPGVPHAVEIEFPTDQDATLAVNVLELDAANAMVQPRHAGGFAVRRGRHASEPVRIDVHRFVFWPTTRHPVVLISNAARGTSPLIARVRILAGPAGLPPAPLPAGRRVHAFLPLPEFTSYGAVGRAGRDGGKPGVDWVTHLSGMGHSAELLAARGAAGAMVTVYTRGAALWPAVQTRQAPRWDSGAAGDLGLDAEPKDLLGLLCRLYGRAGLRIVPALSFDAPLPALEATLAAGGPAAIGIACVGRDGRPRRTGPNGVVHYNILDPRVQRGVEELVVELAGRIRESGAASTVDGIALLMPHDGWLHLPGVDWGLDDVTFPRFLRDIGGAEDRVDDGRFAARAALVEGPLRDRWLDWRAVQLAAFHASLADAIAERDDRLSLSIVPTTLLTAGEVADRFRPEFGPARPAGDVLREVGLDPVRAAAHRRIVFVTPSVRGGEGLSAESLVAAANGSPDVARAAAGAARRAAIVIEESRPVAVQDVLPHGPFGGAVAAAEFRMHPLATGAERGRAYADSLLAADAEAVFDMGLTLEAPAVRSPALEVLAALPARRFSPVAGPSAPVAVRSLRADDATWVHVVNAAAAPVWVTVRAEGGSGAAVDAATQAPVSRAPDGGLLVDVPAWGMRTLRIDGMAAVKSFAVRYDDALAATVAMRVEELDRRRATLESPAAVDVLDNPGFELGGQAGDPSRPGPAVTGWELVEPRRGSLGLVAGFGQAGGRAAAFSSIHGLATLRSNPFPRPASGRVSVAAWLRIRADDPQPPLRMAIEGVRDDQEYYRFAAVGGLAGSRPLTGEWSQFVLQVDDLPDTGLDSLRVRFDLLGPGTVEIDDVRVFELAFDETQRAQLARTIAALEQRLRSGDVGGCLRDLEGHWPRFLEAYVAAVPPAVEPANAGGAVPAAAERTGLLENVRRWWQ